MSGTADDNTPSAEIVPIDPAIVERFAHMATLVPSEDGGGYERILDAILSAETWETLSDPWESTNAEKLRNRRLRIESIMRRPSTFAGGLGVFLVVKSVDTRTGEALVWTTSSLSIVAQLVRAYCLKAFPLVAEVVIADRPTEAGFYPQHLRILAATPAA